MTRKSTRKQQAIKELLENDKMITRKTCRTHVSQSSVDTGTIGYIFLSSNMESKIKSIQIHVVWKHCIAFTDNQKPTYRLSTIYRNFSELNDGLSYKK